MENNELLTLKFKLQDLEKPSYIIDECEEEIINILKQKKEMEKFCKTFYDHVKMFKNHKQDMLNSKKIIEFVVVPKGLKKKLNIPTAIYSYRYKNNGNNKNMRLLFITDDDGFNYFISCFMEKDKSDYNKYIEKTIDRLNKLGG